MWDSTLHGCKGDKTLHEQDPQTLNPCTPPGARSCLQAMQALKPCASGLHLLPNSAHPDPLTPKPCPPPGGSRLLAAMAEHPSCASCSSCSSRCIGVGLDRGQEQRSSPCGPHFMDTWGGTESRRCAVEPRPACYSCYSLSRLLLHEGGCLPASWTDGVGGAGPDSAIPCRTPPQLPATAMPATAVPATAIPCRTPPHLRTPGHSLAAHQATPGGLARAHPATPATAMHAPAVPATATVNARATPSSPAVSTGPCRLDLPGGVAAPEGVGGLLAMMVTQWQALLAALSEACSR